MRGARPQNEHSNDLRPPNLYNNHGNNKQTFNPPVGLQTVNIYIPIPSEVWAEHRNDNRKQVSFANPYSSNS